MLKSNYKWQENYNEITAVCNKEIKQNSKWYWPMEGKCISWKIIFLSYPPT